MSLPPNCLALVRRFRIVLVVRSWRCVSTVADASNAVAADNQPPAGFTALFNGRDLTGWKGLLAGDLQNPIKRAAARRKSWPKRRPRPTKA